MTHEEAIRRYPELLNYITNRNTLNTSDNWCNQLWEDQKAAMDSAFTDVARELKQAQTDYGSYPYNSAMGEFLSLPMNENNNEPLHGYYMACSIAGYVALGEAARKVDTLITARKPLRIVAARSKTTRKPVRHYTFSGPEQIQNNGTTLTLRNGRIKITLSSNWSIETCMERAAAALETGNAYGESSP